MELFNFAFGPYPQRLNIYLAEKRPKDVAVTIYEAPDKFVGVPPPEVKTLTPWGLCRSFGMPMAQSSDSRWRSSNTSKTVSRNRTCAGTLRQRGSGPPSPCSDRYLGISRTGRISSLSAGISFLPCHHRRKELHTGRKPRRHPSIRGGIISERVGGYLSELGADCLGICSIEVLAFMS